jgi:hypothetical protein
MTPSPPECPTPTRRQFLAAGSTATVTAVAGCSNVVNYIADRVLEDVNVFNETNRQVEGTIDVTAPSGETVLDERFDLARSDSESDDDNQDAIIYEDVWLETGSYEVTVALTDTEIEGQSQASAVVDISKPDEEMLAVALGSADLDEPIAFRVGEELTDFE